MWSRVGPIVTREQGSAGAGMRPVAHRRVSQRAGPAQEHQGGGPSGVAQGMCATVGLGQAVPPLTASPTTEPERAPAA